MSATNFIDSPVLAETSPGIPSAANVMSLLYEKSADHLTDSELNWLANPMRAAAIEDLENTSKTIESAALVVANVILSETMLDEDHLGNFLFSLSNQLDAAVGFLKISDDAAYRLKEKSGKNEVQP